MKKQCATIIYILSLPEKCSCIFSVMTHSALFNLISPSMPFTERVRDRLPFVFLPDNPPLIKFSYKR